MDWYLHRAFLLQLGSQNTKTLFWFINYKVNIMCFFKCDSKLVIEQSLLR